MFNLKNSGSILNKHLTTKEEFVDYLNKVFNISETEMSKNEYLNKSMNELITAMLEKNESHIHDEELAKMLSALFIDTQYLDFCFSERNIKSYGALS